MGVNMTKLQDEAPQLVSTVNMVKEISTAKGLNPDTNTAAVLATFDLSGSNEMGSNRNYSSGLMQEVGDLCLASGFAFDDDGEVPFSYFHNHAIDLGNVTPATSQGFVANTWRQHPMGGTSYLAALDWIVQSVGLGDVDLGRRGESLEVKMQTPYPAFAIFATDGEPQDSEAAIEERLRRISQLPIFVQFVGVGNHRFSFLKKLNNLRGTLLDSVGFFDSKDVLNSRRARTPEDRKRLMLSALLSEFPKYYGNARRVGLIG